MTNEERQTVIDALEAAAGAKLADGTYLDKDCKITRALAIMLRESGPVTATAPAYVNRVHGCHECGWGKVAGCWRCGSR